jgi:hypothetical protein
VKGPLKLVPLATPIQLLFGLMFPQFAGQGFAEKYIKTVPLSKKKGAGFPPLTLLAQPPEGKINSIPVPFTVQGPASAGALRTNTW